MIESRQCHDVFPRPDCFSILTNMTNDDIFKSKVQGSKSSSDHTLPSEFKRILHNVSDDI